MSANPINVLHVDDEPGLADMAATFLERENSRFSVETTTNASDGLERLADYGFDCVISDYDMPAKNGIEFLEDVREEDTDLPFILFTGKGSEEIASDAISAGVTDYLQKERGSDQYTILANRIQNVVEGARANREREQMRERMELALEETNSVIFEFDFEKGDVARHGAVERFFETDTERISTFEDYTERVVHPDDRERFQEFYRHLQVGDQDHDAIEYRTNPDHGSVRWFRDHTYVATDNGGIRVLGLARDVTDRRERERELGRRSELFQYVEEVADIGYWEIDTRTPSPHDATLSDGVYRIHELPPDDPFDVEKGLEFYHPEDRPQVRTAVERAIADGQPYDLEVRLITATGSERWVHTVGEPIERDGEIFKVRGVFQDVTDRKRQEEKLARQNDRLEQFASIVSHDLRNPLTVAEGRLELAVETGDTEHLDAVARAHERMRVLIEDMLELAREEEDATDIESVEIAEMVDECWRNVDTAGATLVTDIGREMRADRNRLQQLLENLFRNAIEHGGDDVTVTVGDLPDGFYVADDGSGIPEGEREQVFETGYSTSETGTGFGLSIVRRIADAHGWEVTVTNSEDDGAQFEITGVDVDHS
jgi:signal transduction histidine kinase/DNA-binding NarL/FixJ family response regulator